MYTLQSFQTQNTIDILIIIFEKHTKPNQLNIVQHKTLITLTNEPRDISQSQLRTAIFTLQLFHIPNIAIIVLKKQTKILKKIQVVTDP